MPIERIVGYLSQFGLVGSVDVMELFVGEGGVGKYCARRKLKRGVNFDLVTDLI